MIATTIHYEGALLSSYYSLQDLIDPSLRATTADCMTKNFCERQPTLTVGIPPHHVVGTRREWLRLVASSLAGIRQATHPSTPGPPASPCPLGYLACITRFFPCFPARVAKFLQAHMPAPMLHRVPNRFCINQD